MIVFHHNFGAILSHSDMNTLPTDCVNSITLFLPYYDVLAWGCVCKYTHSLIQRPFLWSQKARLDYGVDITPPYPPEEGLISPPSRFQYLRILSEHSCEQGSEKFISPRKCLRRAGKQGTRRLIRYFESLFNRSDALSHLVGGATRAGNLPLVKELIASHPNELIDIRNFVAKDIGRSGRQDIVDYFGIPRIKNPYISTTYTDPPRIDGDYIQLLCQSAGRSGNKELLQYLDLVLSADMYFSSVAIGAIMGGHIDIFHTYIDCHPVDKSRYCWSLDTAIKYRCEAIIPYLLSKIAYNERHFIYSVIYRASKCNRRDILDTVLAKNIHNHNDLELGLWGGGAGGHIELIEFFIEKGANNLVGALNMCIKHYPKTKALATLDYLMSKIRQSIPDFDFRDVINTVVERGDADLFGRFGLGDDPIRDVRLYPYDLIRNAINRQNIALIRKILDIHTFNCYQLNNLCVISVERSYLDALEVLLPLYLAKADEIGLMYVLPDLAQQSFQYGALLVLDYLVKKGVDTSKLHSVYPHLVEINGYLLKHQSHK